MGISIFGLVVAVVAVGVAFWQGSISKKQLSLAEKSEDRTERALEEIKTLSQENRDLAAGVKKDIDGKINQFLEQQLDRLRQETESKARDDRMSSDMAEKVVGQMFLGGQNSALNDMITEALRQQGNPNG